MNVRPWLAGLLASWMSAAGAVTCDSDGVWVQVIGASKPASSGYILWINGKARALIDAGSSSAINFNNSKARVADLDLVLFTHLHVNRTADLATLVQSSLAEGRASPLPIYGPARSKLMPSTVTFVRTLFDKKRGLYRYLGELVSPFGKRTYKLQPHNIRIKGDNTVDVYANERLRVSAATIMHRPLPSLAWRLEVGGKTLVFSSDLDSEVNGLQILARNADLLIVHNPSRINTRDLWQLRYLSPAAIGRTANTANVKKLVLAHRNTQNQRAIDAIKANYAGLSIIADELDCVSP